MLKKVLVSAILIAVILGVTALPVFANPPSAQGAGDLTDVANQAAGENPPLGPDGEGGFLHNPNDSAMETVFGAIIAHNPLCDIHDDLGNH